MRSRTTGILRRGQRIAGTGVLQADEGGDVAGFDLFDLLALVGVHLEHAADALAVGFGGVQHHVARVQRAGIDAHEGQRAVFVVDDLERQPGERRRRIGLDPAAVRMFAILLALTGGDADAGHVERARQVIDHCIQQRLHALVLESGAAQHRAEGAGNRACLDAALQRGFGDFALLEILLHRRVIDRKRGVQQVLAVFAGALEQVGGNFLIVEPRPQLATFPDDGLHPDQIDDADELVLDADRELQRQRHDIQLLLERRSGTVEVGASAVELVDEDDPGHVVAVGQSPVGFRLRLHAGHALDDEDRAVEHAQANGSPRC